MFCSSGYLYKPHSFIKTVQHGCSPHSWAPPPCMSWQRNFVQSRATLPFPALAYFRDLRLHAGHAEVFIVTNHMVHIPVSALSLSRPYTVCYCLQSAWPVLSAWHHPHTLTHTEKAQSLLVCITCCMTLKIQQTGSDIKCLQTHTHTSICHKLFHPVFFCWDKGLKTSKINTKSSHYTHTLVK